MNCLIRTDANSQIGSGHLMRCLALAQAWQRDCDRAIFATQSLSPLLASRLASENMAVMPISSPAGTAEDARETATLAHHVEAQWLVVDGYHFGTDYQQTIKAAGLFLLVLDDYGHCDRYYADAILNQNISADERWYLQRENDTRLLLGTRYILLRREFWQWQNWQRKIPKIARKI